MNVDIELIRWLNDQAASHSAVGNALAWTAENLAVVVFATAAVGGLIGFVADIRAGRRIRWQLAEAAAVAGLALVVGLGVNQLIGHAWFRTRPSDALPDIHLLLAPSSDPSFPSDHATASFAIALGLSLALPRLGALLLVEALLLGVARVAVGLHYPTDILAGFLIALAAVALSQGILLYLRPGLLSLARRIGPTSLPIQEDPRPRLVPWRTLRIAAIFAAVLAMPMLIEATADPVRLRSKWMELLVLCAIASALACVAAILAKKSIGPRKINRTAG